MTAVRKLGIGAAVLVGLLLVATGVLYVLFDAAAIKRQLVEQVAAKTGRQLTISGELGLSLWPNVAVRVGPVSLSAADGHGEFLKLNSARLAVAVMPLLSKRLEAKRIEIDGLTVNLVKHKDGSLNIDDLTQGKPAPGPAPAAAVSYTHLDVYKRQLLASALSSRALSTLASLLAGSMLRPRSAIPCRPSLAPLNGLAMLCSSSHCDTLAACVPASKPPSCNSLLKRCIQPL